MDSPPEQIDETARRGVDGHRLAERLGIDAGEISSRKQFTGFDADDERRLVELAPTLDRIAEPVVDRFYEHLTGNGETTAVLGRSDKPVEMLKRDQEQYLRDIGRGEYGVDYFERRARIGKLHDMLGLGPKLYLGAYTIYYEGLISGIAEDIRSEFGAAATDGGVAATPDGDTGGVDGRLPEPEAHSGDVAGAVDEFVARTMSVLKLMNLDQQIAMDTYIMSYSEEMERTNARKQALMEEVETEVRAPVTEVGNAAEGVADNAGEIASIANDQSETMRSVSAEVADMSASVEEVAATADGVASTSEVSVSRAEEASASADDAVEGMRAVADATKGMASDFHSLQNRISEVDQIVEVINDIAQQTNLLALNASIEAARAGEAGAGFAVVADEVKSLAEESQQQAGEIENEVAAIRADASATLESLDRTETQVAGGIDQVESTLESLGAIAEAARETSQGILEVAQAADEQATSTEAVAAMIDDAVGSAASLSTAVDDIAAATEEQTAMLDEINAVLDTLTEDEAAR
jgi:heme-based aerotactic transducer